MYKICGNCSIFFYFIYNFLLHLFFTVLVNFSEVTAENQVMQLLLWLLFFNLTHTHLVDLIVLRLILSHQVEEELFGVPVEEWGQVRGHVKAQGTQVILLPGHSILWDILPVRERRNGSDTSFIETDMPHKHQPHTFCMDPNQGKKCSPSLQQTKP